MIYVLSGAVSRLCCYTRKSKLQAVNFETVLALSMQRLTVRTSHSKLQVRLDEPDTSGVRKESGLWERNVSRRVGIRC